MTVTCVVMIFCILKAIGVWLLIEFLGTNLIGFLVRGFFAPVRGSAANPFINLIAGVTICAYLVALYHYWNIFLAIAGVIAMVSRLPGLIWEIRTGRKLTRHDKPDGFIHLIDVPLMLLNLPLIWYALCIYGS